MTPSRSPDISFYLIMRDFFSCLESLFFSTSLLAEETENRRQMEEEIGGATSHFRKGKRQRTKTRSKQERDPFTDLRRLFQT